MRKIIISVFLILTFLCSTAMSETAVEWFNKADALRNEGKYTDPKKAIEYLNNAIKLKPDYAKAYYSRGDAYKNLGQYQRAIKDYNKAIRLKPDDLGYVQRGSVYLELKQFQRAIEDFNEALRLKPDDALLYSIRGNIYSRLSQYQFAIRDFSKGIRLKPDDADAYSGRGTAYADLGQYQRAIDDYNEAIRLKPDHNAFYYSDRAGAYEALGDHQKAIDDYSKAIELAPNDALAYGCRGDVYAAMHNYELAIQDFNTALDKNPSYAIYMDRGTVYLNGLKEYVLAIKDFTKAIELKPDSSKAYSYRGAAYSSLDKDREALEDVKEAARLGDEFAKDFLAKREQKEKNTLRLICDIQGGNYGPDVKKLYVINLEKKTANGNSAEITENQIFWTQSSVSFLIDRYAGQITITSDNGALILVGKCSKTSEKKF